MHVQYARTNSGVRHNWRNRQDNGPRFSAVTGTPQQTGSPVQERFVTGH